MVAAGSPQSSTKTASMIRRLGRSVDFEQVLGTPPRARSAHFAIHHLFAEPSPAARACRAAEKRVQSSELILEKPLDARVQDGLSTAMGQTSLEPVDSSLVARSSVTPPGALWLGTVVPKRHARRAVTRTLLKRQIRAAFDVLVAQARPELPAGLWVVRLRSPFAVTDYPSAASAALRQAAAGELRELVQKVAQRASQKAAQKAADHASRG